MLFRSVKAPAELRAKILRDIHAAARPVATPEKFSPWQWLFTIQHSIFVNKYRKAQREPNIVSFDELETDFERLLTDEQWPGVCATLAEPGVDWSAPEVSGALTELPENFRMAVLLVDVDGLTYEEAAGVVDCPVGTLRSRLFRARRILFLKLRDYAERVGVIRRHHV